MRQIQKTFFALGTANTVAVFDQELSAESGMKLLNDYHLEGIFMEESGATYVTPGLADKFNMGKKEINNYG